MANQTGKTVQVEIMSPAGSFESLAAALNAGADSVYFGVGNLNMRSRAAVNFTPDDLPEIVNRCHEHHAKAYLTLNIIVYDDELEDMKSLCDAALKCGVDAVIASDISVISYACKIGLPVHISVQANVCNMEAVRFYARYAEVMVLARELTLKQIRGIIEGIEKENIRGPGGELVRIEIFAHGALCVAVSGKCYMSLGAYNASANRGGCFQNCRRSYKVTDEQTGYEMVIDNKYVMSPKDLCTVSVLDQLIEAGVSVLKLEGRGRSADYVGTVTSVYKEASLACLDNTFNAEKVERWLERLGTVFNRGFWLGGYYLGTEWGEWSGSGNNRASRLKTHIGKVTNYYKKSGVAEILLDGGSFMLGDTLLATGPTTGALEWVPGEIRANVDDEMKSVSEGEKGGYVYVSVPEAVRRNDKIYLIKPKTLQDC